MESPITTVYKQHLNSVQKGQKYNFKFRMILIPNTKNPIPIKLKIIPPIKESKELKFSLVT